MKKETKEWNSINNKEFLNIIEDLVNNETVQEMKKYRQHYETSCFDHCYMVSYYCYLICKKYHLNYRSATRAAMLHAIRISITGVFENLTEKDFMLSLMEKQLVTMQVNYLIYLKKKKI